MTRHLKPAGGFEIGGVVLHADLGFVPRIPGSGHLFITHILNTVETINDEFVAGRWGDPRTGVFWRLWDLTMINLAVLHGGNGLRQVLDEYVIRRGRRKLMRTLIWCGAIFLMRIGTVHGQILRDVAGSVVPGLDSAGESACVSVHGANRLGTNSLVNLVVYGRRTGRAMAEYARQREFEHLPPHPEAAAKAEIDGLLSRPKTEPWAKIRDEMQTTMIDNCGVYRSAETLTRARDDIAALKDRYRNLGVQDKGSVFNTNLLEVLELGNLLDLSEATVAAALARTESRGAHSREDFPNRNDVDFFKHSLVNTAGVNQTSVVYKDVDVIIAEKDGQRVPKYPLEVRKY